LNWLLRSFIFGSSLFEQVK